MKYFEELKRSMTWLGEQENTLFLGQAVAYPGTGMTNTLVDVPKAKLIEMPVNEDMQMGMSIGMSLNGTVPISIYPRWNFMILAANQIVNHLDKLKYKELFIAVGSRDQVVPLKESVEFFEEHKTSSISLKIYDTDHTITRGMRQDIYDFIERN